MKINLTLAHLLALAFFLLIISIITIQAQTSAFTYQGRFTSNSMPANGTYTMKFRLYGSIDQNDQIGSEQTAQVTAANGIFSVELDFGASSFPAGANRWLEVQIGATTLSPRQKLNASPFAVRSLDANEADALSTVCNPCVTDAQIVGISGSKVTGTVDSANTANSATTALTANNASNLGGVPSTSYLQTSGGETLTGNGLKLDGTIAQPGAGDEMNGGDFTNRGGFWNPIIAPTAASANVGGQVINMKGSPIKNVVITMTGGNMFAPRTARTNAFGYFTFEDVEVGHFYILTISSKRFGFAPDSQSFTLNDNLTDIVFQASWEN